MFAPEYVLILSGDHIYKMNYDKMLDYHKAVSYTHLVNPFLKLFSQISCSIAYLIEKDKKTEQTL